METNETVWQAVVGFLGLVVGGLLAVIKVLMSKVHAKATPEDVLTVQLMRRDIDSIKETLGDLGHEVDKLVRRAEIQDRIDKQPGR